MDSSFSTSQRFVDSESRVFLSLLSSFHSFQLLYMGRSSHSSPTHSLMHSVSTLSMRGRINLRSREEERRGESWSLPLPPKWKRGKITIRFRLTLYELIVLTGARKGAMSKSEIRSLSFFPLLPSPFHPSFG